MIAHITELPPDGVFFLAAFFALLIARAIAAALDGDR